MKPFLLILVATILLSISALTEDINPLRPKIFLFATNAIEYENTNLVVFGPPYGANSPANIPEMLATNGMECFVEASRSRVYIYNYATNNMTCLRMPGTNLLKIALLDKEGHQVKKTELGKMYGLPLSQEQIDYFRHQWNTTRQSVFIKIFPDGDPQTKNVPTEICYFNLKDAFEITSPGEYELHLQLRLVQVGTDKSGKFYYPVTWLPETVAKVQIRSGDIIQTNALAK